MNKIELKNISTQNKDFRAGDLFIEKESKEIYLLTRVRPQKFQMINFQGNRFYDKEIDISNLDSFLTEFDFLGRNMKITIEPNLENI